MKKILSITTFLFSAFLSFSQDIHSVGIQDEFKTISGFGRRQTGFEGIQTYSSHAVNGSQFFTETWAPGSVTSNSNFTVNKGFVFLYDKVRQELFMKHRDSNFVLLIDKDQIKTFTINSDRVHVFMPATAFDTTLKGNFAESLVPAGDYRLYKLIRTSFEKANVNDMERVKQGDFNDKFVDQITYFITRNNEVKKITTLTERNLRKALKEESKKLDSFFEAHENSELSDDLLVMLVNSLNE